MKLLIVIPCYNEQAMLPQTFVRLHHLCEQLKHDASIDTQLLFVDDGSADDTWALIAQEALNHQHVSGVRLARNVGHQSALWAGMEQAHGHCDCMVSIDADLQDDETAIVDMVQRWREGADIVYGVRSERKTDTWFKRNSAQAFYWFMQLMDTRTLYNHADFRLLSARALDALLQYPERNLFLRGMVRQLGFNEATVYYKRTERAAGESKYPLARMLRFSVDGITSFSTAPLRWITLFGLLMTCISVVMIVFALVRHFSGQTITGWTSLLVSLWFIGGVVTTGIGIIGIYVGKIYLEVKHRPRYFIADKTN